VGDGACEGRLAGARRYGGGGSGVAASASEPKSGGGTRWADEVIVNPPEALPVVGGTNVELRITRDAATEVGVVLEPGR